MWLSYLGQAQGAFFLACHAAKGYDVEAIKQGDFSQEQCVGAAVFRANAGYADRLPDLLLKADKDPEQFTDAKDFLRHYMGDERAEQALMRGEELWLMVELEKISA